MNTPASENVGSGEVVRNFFERLEARDWEGAGELLSPTVHIEFSETGEQFDGPNYLAMNRAYPDGWSIEVVEVISENDRAGVQLRVEHGETTFSCAGFYRVVGDVIVSGVEHWVEKGSHSPPAWRQQFRS